MRTTLSKQIMVRKGEIGMTGDILTATEVAGRLRVSLPWLYKQIKAGVIPHLKVGGVIRFSLSPISPNRRYLLCFLHVLRYVGNSLKGTKYSTVVPA